MAVFKKAYADTVAVNVIDSRSAVAVSLGAATATKVDVGRTGVTTEVKGPLAADAGVTVIGAVAADSYDSRLGAPLPIGTVTAGGISIGRPGVTTDIKGPLVANLDAIVVGDLYFDRPTFDFRFIVADQTVGPGSVVIPNLLGASGTMVYTAFAQTLLNKTIVGTTNQVRASELGTTGASVVVSGAAQPVAGQILTATTPSAAAWAAPALTGPGISIDKGIVTFNGTSGAVFQSAGVRHYGALATDPVAPAPAVGDMYHNTALNHLMTYDASRASWLSVATFTIGFGRNGGTNAGSFYRGYDGLTVTSTNSVFCPKGTIVFISFNTSAVVAHTFDVLIGGVLLTSLVSGALVSTSSSSVSAPFSAGVISAQNRATSATTNNLQAIIVFKLRI